MTGAGSFPRRFGEYLLTAPLGEDALGKVFRALRVSGERGFVRLRILESPEISEDAVLDTIQEFGEIHSFLKNPAIARGVQMDAVEGVPFIAWNEESGRTLDTLLARVRQLDERVGIEHALFIAEKIATALDHAYNTAVDGERTLHGLVWPGFISLSDDGEIRLAGFGLAPAFYNVLEKPRFAEEIAPYLAPGERSGKRIGKSSDVFSVGVILFELLAGRLPSSPDPLEDVSALARQEASSLPPEAVSLLRMSLAPAQSRFPTAGELRRELGRLLFAGPSSPSTFSLAFFLNSLFRAEIQVEAQARAKEATLDPAAAAHPLPRKEERGEGLTYTPAVTHPLPSGDARGVGGAAPRFTSAPAATQGMRGTARSHAEIGGRDSLARASGSEQPAGRSEGVPRPLPSGGARGVGGAAPRLTSVSAEAAGHSSRSERPEGRGEGVPHARSSSRGAAPSKPGTPKAAASHRRRSPPRRRPAAFVGGALLAAAVLGGIFVVARRPARSASARQPLLTPTAAALPTATPQSPPAAAAPTAGVSESEFQEEVSRRVADKLKKLEEELKKSAAKTEATPAPATRTPGMEPARPQSSPAGTGRAPLSPSPAALPPAAESPAPAEAPPAETPPSPEPTGLPS